MPNAIRILAADRRPLAISGLAHILAEAPDLHLAGHANRQIDLEQALNDCRVHLIVLDPTIYADGPPDAVHAIRRITLAAILLKITHIDDSLLRALGQEQVSCVSAYSDAPTILEAIRSLAHGRPNLPSDVQQAFAARFLRRRAPSNTLTDRERHILGLAADGLTAHAIATTLNISQSTTKTHLHRVYAKLGATNRSSAIASAIRSGILSATLEANNNSRTTHLAAESAH